MARVRSMAPASPYLALLAQQRLRRCLYGLDNLPCFLLLRDERTGRVEWWELLGDERLLRPYDFDFRFGKARQRDAYHARNFDRIRKSGRYQVATLWGWSDLYVPLFVEPHTTLAFYAGQWTDRLPSYEQLTTYWRQVSGRVASGTDPLFRRWLRASLRVCVLDRARRHGLVKLAGLLGSLFLSPSNPETLRSLEELRKSVFLPRAVDHNWIRSCLDMDGLTRPPWGLDDFEDPRLVEELALREKPTFVSILTLDARHRNGERLREWVLARQLQLETMRQCRLLPNCLAGPLGESWAIVALTVPRGIVGAKRAQHLSKLVRQLQELLWEKCHLRTVAGIGLEALPGEPLGNSYRQAMASLDAAIRTRQTLMRFESAVTAPVPTLREYRRLSEDLTQQLRERNYDQVRLNGARLARAILSDRDEGCETARFFLSFVLESLVEVLELRKSDHRERRNRRIVNAQIGASGSARSPS